jgi:hypothetical protein
MGTVIIILELAGLVGAVASLFDHDHPVLWLALAVGCLAVALLLGHV